MNISFKLISSSFPTKAFFKLIKKMEKISEILFVILILDLEYLKFFVLL